MIDITQVPWTTANGTHGIIPEFTILRPTSASEFWIKLIACQIHVYLYFILDNLPLQQKNCFRHTGSLKTWISKVHDFSNFDHPMFTYAGFPQAWKVLEYTGLSWKVLEN